MSAPVSGDRQYFGNVVGNFHFFGILTDEPMMTSMEVTGNDGVHTPDITVCLPVCYGDTGQQGDDSDIVKMQWEDNLISPSQLPELTDSPSDIGKAWWIENCIYTWSGTDWFQNLLGVAGPAGASPRLDFSTELVPSNTLQSLTQPINIVQEGTPENPSLHFQFDQDSITGNAGPTGGPLRDSSDYDNSIEPGDGDAIVWYEKNNAWGPSPFDRMQVLAYSVPQTNFQPYSGSSSQQLICSFPIPPQPFSWRPISSVT